MCEREREGERETEKTYEFPLIAQMLGGSDKLAVAVHSESNFILSTQTLGAEFKRAASYTGESTIDFLPPSVATVQLTELPETGDAYVIANRRKQAQTWACLETVKDG